VVLSDKKRNRPTEIFYYNIKFGKKINTHRKSSQFKRQKLVVTATASRDDAPAIARCHR